MVSVPVSSSRLVGIGHSIAEHELIIGSAVVFSSFGPAWCTTLSSSVTLKGAGVDVGDLHLVAVPLRGPPTMFAVRML